MQRVFNSFYEDSIYKVITRLKKETDSFVEPVVFDGIEQSIYMEFYKASVRVLILELHLCKDYEMLEGTDSVEEYECFEKMLQDKVFCKKILQKYPGLNDYLAELKESQYQFWKEVLERLKHDWTLIQKHFFSGEIEQKVIEACTVGADIHCGGKSVVRFETNKGLCFFYKPHTLANELALQELTEQMYRSLGEKDFSYHILDFGEYGWEEEVKWCECGNVNDVEEAYRKSGILASLMYVLGTQDLHYENVIMHGSYPVIVDVESLVSSQEPLFRWHEKRDNFYTVLSSSLFPGGNTSCKFAGMTGGNEELLEYKIPIVVDERTSDMRIEYKNPVVVEGKNRIILQGNKTLARDYVKFIIYGFERGYYWICDNSLIVKGILRKYRNRIKSRYVRKDTMLYDMLIRASTHPELLLQKDGRLRFLEKIKMEYGMSDWEVRSISRGDIPYSFLKLIDKNLYIDDGEYVIENYFESTLWENIDNRMQQMSKEDCALQKEVLHMSLRHCSGMNQKNIIFEREKENVVDNREMKTGKLIWNLMNNIMKRRIQFEDSTFWLTLRECGNESVIEPMDMYFYSGISGMAVLFRKCQQEYGGYEKICNQLEKMMLNYTERLYRGKMKPITNYTGMYCGESSVMYAWQLIYHMTGEKNYSEYASKHAEVLKDLIEEDIFNDLLYGNAGAVLVLCRQYEDTGNVRFLQYAKKALTRLDSQRIQTKDGISWLEEGVGNPICSAAHGNSGILLAYAKMQSLDSAYNFHDKMIDIIRYEDRFFDEKRKNWADLRSMGEQYNTYAWCNGGIGIVWARMKAYEILPNEHYLLESIRKAKDLLCNVPIKEDMCLCHGNGGNYLILCYAERAWSQDTELYGKKMELKEEMDCKMREIMWKDYPLIGLMNGYGGVILALFEGGDQA